jgi:uncharacterized BrkB/YihY/UPF0761 family membrane protein
MICPDTLIARMREWIKELARNTYLIFKHAGKQYGVDRVNRMAAAISYRAIFAMAPLLILAVAIVGCRSNCGPHRRRRSADSSP